MKSISDCRKELKCLFARRTCVVVLPAMAVYIFLWLRLYHPDQYIWMITEDGVVEYAQAGMYLLSAMFAGILGRLYLKSSSDWFGRWTGGMFVLLSLGLLFVVGEEISWGQRILGVETPEAIRRINRQGEITLHNLAIFDNILHKAYILVGIYAVFGMSLVGACFPGLLQAPFKNVLVDRYQTIAFIPFLILYTVYDLVDPFLAATLNMNLLIWRDQEQAEFYLAMGFCIFTYCRLMEYRNTVSNARGLFRIQVAGLE